MCHVFIQIIKIIPLNEPTHYNEPVLSKPERTNNLMKNVVKLV